MGREVSQRIKRQVRIKLFRSTWTVVYCQRVYRGRYWAGQFDAAHCSRGHVVKWVKKQPHLELVNEPI